MADRGSFQRMIFDNIDRFIKRAVSAAHAALLSPRTIEDLPPRSPLIFPPRDLGAGEEGQHAPGHVVPRQQRNIPPTESVGLPDVDVGLSA